jgi:hypothetical protein
VTQVKGQLAKQIVPYLLLAKKDFQATVPQKKIVNAVTYN